MKPLLLPVLLASTLALTACADKADTPAATAAAAASDAAAPATAPATTAPAVTEAAPGATDPMAGMGAADHAAMDAANKSDGTGDPGAAGSSKPDGAGTGVQAGWYTAGTFRACGSAQAMKVDKTADIDAQIKKGGMSAGDPVYVQVEGMPMGESFMLTRVVQVGSTSPVRDCPMTGTTTQAGG